MGNNTAATGAYWIGGKRSQPLYFVWESEREIAESFVDCLSK
mgnify:CR=1 FL=1